MGGGTFGPFRHGLAKRPPRFNYDLAWTKHGEAGTYLGTRLHHELEYSRGFKCAAFLLSDVRSVISSHVGVTLRIYKYRVFHSQPLNSGNTRGHLSNRRGRSEKTCGVPNGLQFSVNHHKASEPSLIFPPCSVLPPPNAPASYSSLSENSHQK